MTTKKQGNIVEKLFLGFFITFTIITIIVTIPSSIFLQRYTNMIQHNVEQRLMITAELAARTIINGDELNDFWSLNDLDDEVKAQKYEDIILKMRDFADEYGLIYVYYMRNIGNDEEQMIIDSDPEEPLGLDYTESMDEYTKYVFENRKSICMALGDYNKSWVGIIAAYAPVYDSNNNLVAIVGVDFTDVDILDTKEITGILTWIYVVCAIFLALTAIALLYLFRTKARAYQSASIAKSEFLSRMSHEIRTPMNAIIGFSRMANEATHLDEIKPFLTRINESSAFLMQLINSILDISKIEAGKMQLTMNIASPELIMNNINDMLRNLAISKNIELITLLEGNIPRYIYCDNVYLTQIIVNLLSNSLKFTSENGKITAAIKILDQKEKQVYLEFSVQDNGIGIKKEYLLKIFEAFEQAEGGITRKYGGTGLGLNISKLLVNLMGGDLKVESQEGKGSRFWFAAWFDIADKEDVPKEAAFIPDDEKVLDITGKNVLIFEDNEINQIIAGNAIEGFGANVEFAENGKIGFEKYLENPAKYSMILMDIQMPEMDGYEATKLIRSSNCTNAKTIPIIAMSANVFKEDIDASLSAGMNAHIGKPFEIKQLTKIIYEIINK